MKKNLLLLLTGVLFLNIANSQETLQTVTDRGSSTTNNISVSGTGTNYFRGATTVDSAWLFKHNLTSNGVIIAQTGMRSDNFGPIASVNSNLVTFTRPLNVSASTAMQMKGTTGIANGTTQIGINVIDSLTWSSNVHANGWSQFKLSPVLNTTGYTGTIRGLYVYPALTGTTNFRAIETNVTSGNGYQIYASGTAPSFFAGNIGIGVSAPEEKLHVAGNILTTQKFYVGSLYRNIGDVVQADGLSHVMSFRNTTGQGNPLGGFDFGDIAGVSWVRIVAGNVGIGTTTPQSKLAVNGDITAKRVKVTTSGWADYVFAPSYQLAPLQQVETYIRNNKHLPEVPTEAEIKKEGLDLGSNQAILLKKIEELTLYIIEQNKQLEAQKQHNITLENRLSAIEKKLTR